MSTSPASMKIAGVYVRVSTVNHGQSVDMQLNDLRKLAAQRGFEIAAEYDDKGQSGGKASRPALDRMLRDAQRGKFQVLLIWRLDRLGRSTSHLLKLLEDFRSWGVELVSFSEGLDFTTTAGKLFYTLLGAFAEFEKDTIRERIRGGLRNARARGVKLGRPAPVFDAAKIHKRIAAGESMTAIGKALGVSASTICRRARAA